MQNKYKVIDLFAGAGGLSLGFEQTGQFDIKAAFEKNAAMQATYSQNFPRVKVCGDVCKTDFAELSQQYGPIDLVIGGPPCQGFSNANRQHNNIINKNNLLIKQYVRAIRELKPKMFVLENVRNLCSSKHSFLMSKEDKAHIESWIASGFKVKTGQLRLKLIDGSMQPGELGKIRSADEAEALMIDKALFSELSGLYRARSNLAKFSERIFKHKSNLKRHLTCLQESGRSDEAAASLIFALDYVLRMLDDDTALSSDEALDILKVLQRPLMIQKMLYDLHELFENEVAVEDIVEDNESVYAVLNTVCIYDYLLYSMKELGYATEDHILQAGDYGVPQRRQRFVMFGIRTDLDVPIVFPKQTCNESNYLTVRDAIGDLEKLEVLTDLTKDRQGLPYPEDSAPGSLGIKLRDGCNSVKNHITPDSTDIAKQRFKSLKPGESFLNLSEDLININYSNPQNTQKTIYRRLDYDEPSPTVVNVRKSMWIHPSVDRALSVREAARLQSFPDSFVFCGIKDAQYQQVGNAVPPMLASAIAKAVADMLADTEGTARGETNER